MGIVSQTGNDIRASDTAMFCAQARAIAAVCEPRVCSVQSSRPVPSWVLLQLEVKNGRWNGR